MINFNNDIQILASVRDIDLREDERLLIPFISGNKWGLLNPQGQIVLGANYDIIIGECRAAGDLLMLGVNMADAYESRGKMSTYVRRRYGLVDSRGRVLFEPQFRSVLTSDDNTLISVMKDGAGCAVLDLDGNEVIPYGLYSYIDGFDHGHARVKSFYNAEDPDNSCKYGIVRTDGSVALPCEYSNIWNFYRKNRTTTRVENSREGPSFEFPLVQEPVPVPLDRYDEEEPYGSHYGEYAGSYAQDVMGYSDDVINDAFEGDPEAYWNID